jgi:hypothetical protein
MKILQVWLLLDWFFNLKHADFPIALPVALLSSFLIFECSIHRTIVFNLPFLVIQKAIMRVYRLMAFKDCFSDWITLIAFLLFMRAHSSLRVPFSAEARFCLQEKVSKRVLYPKELSCTP